MLHVMSYILNLIYYIEYDKVRFVHKNGGRLLLGAAFAGHLADSEPKRPRLGV